MEELIVYDADFQEVYDIIASFFDENLWFEDVHVYQNSFDVIIDSPRQASDDIMRLLFNNGYDVDIY